MALATVSFRVDDGLIKAYDALAKRLRVTTSKLLRETLFLALLNIDATQTGKVSFVKGR